jgi:hypothetical protein
MTSLLLGKCGFSWRTDNAPLTRAGGQTALAWYPLQLADVPQTRSPVPWGAAWD